MYRIAVQKVATEFTPQTTELRLWAREALEKRISDAEVTLRVVDVEEMTELNKAYRKKSGPTNVLSFPAELPESVKIKVPPLGDIIICAAVVNQEAQEQHKTPAAHWAHMVVHGILHLLKYDHETNDEADIMEAEEIKILKSLGFANPYLIGGKHE